MTCKSGTLLNAGGLPRCESSMVNAVKARAKERQKRRGGTSMMLQNMFITSESSNFIQTGAATTMSAPS